MFLSTRTGLLRILEVNALLLLERLIFLLFKYIFRSSLPGNLHESF